ncbi:MAG: DUF1905 domain-containing protein [Saprospiraceae bacterium]|nr:DUF1905 domain-containing protein [Saprospiraceae bacterium]
MIKFQTIIRKFDKKGEKTGWTYAEISLDIAQQINPGIKTSYRVKGFLDQHPVEGLSILPMGGGNFILPLNAAMRKLLHKKAGERINLELMPDSSAYQLHPELLEALESDPKAIAHFNTLSKSHRNYFSKWIETAKTPETRFKRIEACFFAMLKKQGYPEMMREKKLNKPDL